MFGNEEKESKKELKEYSNSSNIIGKGTVIEGNISTFGNIRIEGKILGNIKTKSKIAQGESSVIDGNIVAQNAELAGDIKGVIEVTDLLVLKPTAIINGDLITNKLVIEAGASFNGKCKMGAVIKDIKIGETGQQEDKVKEIKTA
ncbi:MAG: polymer-forming cytoskeletal protein [Cytophagales bacterium]|nr:polymer-forming cytoskeletal protein [Cytophagales bacterium]